MEKKIYVKRETYEIDGKLIEDLNETDECDFSYLFQATESSEEKKKDLKALLKSKEGDEL